MNDEFVRLFGYAEADSIGLDIDTLFAPEDSELSQEAVSITQQVASGELIRIESLRRRKDGSLVDVSILAKDILLGGETVGVYGIYRDISESKKMASALERERALFEQLFSSAPEAIVLCDSGSTILRESRRVPRLVGGDEFVRFQLGSMSS